MVILPEVEGKPTGSGAPGDAEAPGGATPEPAVDAGARAEPHASSGALEETGSDESEQAHLGPLPRNVGSYVIVGRLAGAGMAEVLLAHKMSRFGYVRRAVIKRVSKSRPGYRNLQRMLLDEARATAFLDHPNVASILDVDEDEQGIYIALEYVEGTDLRWVNAKLRARREALPFELACYMTAEVLRGLHHAHSALDPEGKPLEIVHRDVNPSNVLISVNGHVKLTDFGVVRMKQRVQQHTEAGLVKGKYGYLAPEYIAGEPCTQRSDIYATGVMLFELLTGRECFSGSTTYEVMWKIVNRGVPYYRLERESVPEDLSRIIQKATSPVPERRYASAQEMANALETWLIRNEKHATPWVLSVFFRRHKLYPDQQDEAPAAPEGAGATPGASAAGAGASVVSLDTAGSGNLPAARAQQSPAATPTGPVRPLEDARPEEPSGPRPVELSRATTPTPTRAPAPEPAPPPALEVQAGDILEQGLPRDLSFGLSSEMPTDPHAAHAASPLANPDRARVEQGVPIPIPLQPQEKLVPLPSDARERGPESFPTLPSFPSGGRIFPPRPASLLDLAPLTAARPSSGAPRPLPPSEEATPIMMSPPKAPKPRASSESPTPVDVGRATARGSTPRASEISVAPGSLRPPVKTPLPGERPPPGAERERVPIKTPSARAPSHTGKTPRPTPLDEQQPPTPRATTPSVKRVLGASMTPRPSPPAPPSDIRIEEPEDEAPKKWSDASADDPTPPPAGRPSPAGEPWSGRLEEISPAAALDQLSQAKASGLLEFRCGLIWKRVQLEKGSPLAIMSNMGMELIGEHLVKARLLTRRELDRALHASEREGVQLTAKLIELGLIEQARLEEELGSNLSARLSEVLEWRWGTFEFTPQAVEPTAIRPRLDLPAVLAQALAARAQPDSEEEPRPEGSEQDREQARLKEAFKRARSIAESTGKGRVEELGNRPTRQPTPKR